MTQQLRGSNVRIRALALLIAISWTVSSASAAAKHSMDGRSWRAVSESSRELYLVGLNDGLNEAAAVLLGGDERGYQKYIEFYKPYDPQGMSVEEIRNGIDLIYADPANLNVRVIDALRGFMMRAHGLPKSQVETYLESARRKANALKTPPQP